MKKKLPVLNFLLILILFLLLGWTGHTWLHPKFPATVKGEDIVPKPRDLETSALSRQVYSDAVVGDVARLNLFRKQRKKYYRPQPPKPKPRNINPAPPKVAVAPPPPPPKATAPPPQLVLTGVMLLDDKRVAIFEGTYSEIRGGRLVQNLKPRRRGYKIGETLGNYKIKTIDKSHATLSAMNGSNLTLTISKTPPTQKIQKAGNNLIQKSKPVSNYIPGKSSTRRTRRSQPIQKSPFNRASPPASVPPVVSVPDDKAPAPVPPDPKRLPRLRQKSMGF